MVSQPEAKQPAKTYRGTWDQVLAHRDEIPGDMVVEVRVYEKTPTPRVQTATMSLMKLWLEEDETHDPEEVATAEKELLQFKVNMNQPRKEAGARLLYPEAE